MKMKIRYYLGLIFIAGAIIALVLQFRNARILSYDMLPPGTGKVAPIGSSH